VEEVNTPLSPTDDRSIAEFCQIFKEELIPILLKLSNELKREAKLII
jgi:hypothetical protein